MIPIVFGPSRAQLLGTYHAPPPEVARATGVVLCNPFGYEAMCAHRTYRHLAERLAAAGFDVLRFDYHGTGDSSGRSDEPYRIRAWIDSIGAAVDELRSIAGVTVVDLLGVRLGATLATLAAGERGDIRAIVLWAPAISGRAYVRELRALELLNRGSGRPGLNAANGPFEPATLLELSAVNLLAQRERPAERALILPRDDVPTGEEALALHLRERGVETELRAAPGYALMMDHPEIAVVPSVTLDAVVAWLRVPEGPIARRRPADRARHGGVLTAWSHAPSRRVREEALSFGDGDRLFGILTEGEETGGGRTGIVFLNAGANHRVGPNRLYVSLARDLAARGYPAFRFDVGGLGDGRPAPGMPENQVYSKDSVVDVQAAMTFLASIRSIERFVLVGICSGGFLAFHTSAQDARVAGQIAINPQTFEWKKGDPLELLVKKGYRSTRYYMQALWRPRMWALALLGRLDVRGVAGALRNRSAAKAAVRLKGLVARWRGLPEARNEVERVFRTVSDRGVRSLLVFSSNDGGLDMIERHLGSGASRMKGHANLRLEIVDGADHTFTQSDPQSRLKALITRFVEASWPAHSNSLDDRKLHEERAAPGSRDHSAPEPEAMRAAPGR